ncbi:MAG: hypothetical protein ACR2GO_03750 [Candidatus Limnocylindria bacterium]
MQAQVRPLLQKQRDAGVATLILVIKDNAENRRLIREAGGPVRDLFPLGSREVLEAIREGRDPGRNGIVFWRTGSPGRDVHWIATSAACGWGSTPLSGGN